MKGRIASVVMSGLGFFDYVTPRVMHIKSTKIGVIKMAVQFTIVAYTIGYVLIWQKGYQSYGNIDSVVVTKVKGVTYNSPNFTCNEAHKKYQHLYHRVWDVADFVIPPTENGALFIMTNMILTPNQTQGTCPEALDVKEARCNPENNTCVKDATFAYGNGAATGRCIPSSSEKNDSIHVCEVHAWCPVENDIPVFGSHPIMEGAKHYTIMVKNSISFPKFGPSYKHHNVLYSHDKDLKKCTYHPENHPYCPIFKLGDMISGAGEDFSNISLRGALISMTINWECNLDFDIQYCLPKYTFNRLDTLTTTSPGFNFRYADYHELSRRTLHKVFGIRITITVQGRAGKFNMASLLFNLGPGIALLGLTPFLCDLIVLNMMSNSAFYRKHKSLHVQEDKLGPHVENAVENLRAIGLSHISEPVVEKSVEQESQDDHHKPDTSLHM